jgi:integrase
MPLPAPDGSALESPRLLDRVRGAVRVRHYSPRTETAYVAWIRRFILFHHKRHPEMMGPPEVNAFLTDLATRQRVSASTQNQALSALLFLYEAVLGRPLGELGDVVRARRPARLPVVLTRAEVSAGLGGLSGSTALMAALIYGSGLRLLECCQLRVKDVDLERSEVLVRDAKGGRDRVTMLPSSLRTLLARHLAVVRTQHQADLAAGAGSVALPEGLSRKVPQGALGVVVAVGVPRDAHLVEPRAGLRRRDASPRRRLRHPDHPRATGASRCGHDHGLHPRPQSRRQRRQESARRLTSNAR